MSELIQFIVGVLLGVGVGVCIADYTIGEAFERDFGEELMAQCESDGLEDCHLEMDYEGLIITGVEAVGREK